MYCPYCKDELEIKNEELFCKTTGCYFSKHIEKVFKEKIEDSRRNQEIQTDCVNNEEGHFYCVNCGNKMKRSGLWQEVCINCGFEINKSMYHEIIELNPHQSL